jgi:hypothetical protein
LLSRVLGLLLPLLLVGACAGDPAVRTGKSSTDWRNGAELGADYGDERAQRMARQSLLDADLVVGVTDEAVWALSDDGQLRGSWRADDEGIARLADSVATYVATAQERGWRTRALLFVVDETTEEHTPVELSSAINARLREHVDDKNAELSVGTLRLRDAAPPF